MQEGNFKNTIVLKNIPSNIIEEAIIVLKENKKAWKLEKVKNKENKTTKEIKPMSKDYVVSEAEMIVSNYISEMKEEKEKPKEQETLKYKRLKRYAYITTAILLIQALCNLIS